VRRAERYGPGPKSAVILIGGAEDKSGRKEILREVARRSRGAPLALCTAGSAVPDETFQLYETTFNELGVSKVVHLDIRKREEADDIRRVGRMAECKVFFFSGGDQLRITSMVAGSRLDAAIRDLYRRGGTVAGTSAGASALGHTMPMSTELDDHKVAAAWQLVPGLALLRGVIVDQHFAQRGRMGRLIAGVAENPRLLGIGIDENTALIWNRESCTVMGSGAVYVVDGLQISGSNLGSAAEQMAVSVFDLRLHVLSAGDSFNMAARRPLA
jgi:cyanophycinase